MRSFALSLLCVGLATAAGCASQPPRPGANMSPLTGVRCLDPSPTSGWTYIDDSNLLIDGGLHKYKVELSQPCWGLKFQTHLGFKGDPMTGRVCGTLGDEIVTREMRCQIKSMQLISTDEYRQIIRDTREAEKARKAEKAAAKSGQP